VTSAEPLARAGWKLPQTRSEWLIITLLTAVLGSVWIHLTRLQPVDANASGLPPSADVGHPAPDFMLQTLDGETVRLSDFRGRPVILNFWASWCGPCRTEIAALQDAWRKVEGDAVIIGVDVQEDAQIVSAFATERGMTYPLVLDLAGEVNRTYRVYALPTTYFIDANGIVSELYTGALNVPLIQRRVDELSLPTP
jgi:cytochrome c biogenesis protein CcmG, thiol:disulfide interchange protein DsbE